MIDQRQDCAARQTGFFHHEFPIKAFYHATTHRTLRCPPSQQLPAHCPVPNVCALNVCHAPGLRARGGKGGAREKVERAGGRRRPRASPKGWGGRSIFQRLGPECHRRGGRLRRARPRRHGGNSSFGLYLREAGGGTRETAWDGEEEGSTAEGCLGVWGAVTKDGTSDSRESAVTRRFGLGRR